MTTAAADPETRHRRKSGGSTRGGSHDGINLWVAALFLLGTMAGAGIVAIPNAFLNAGWWAIIIVTVLSMVGCLTGLQLSWSWSILQENWPEYAEQTRNPYPEIAQRAGGYVWRYAVQASVHCAMFGSGVALLILSSQNISRLIRDWFQVEINFCQMVLIVAAVLLPFMFLGTPKDFWLIAVGAIAATAMAIIFIMIGTVSDMESCRGVVTYPSPTIGGFLSAYCTICFAYGGHAAFPTIQHDMKQPSKFPLSVLVSFVALFIMYFPMPVLAYSIYGHTVMPTIEANLSTQWIRDVILVLITGHVLLGFFIVISPVIQDFERIVGIPLDFSWQRICTRSFMMATILFVALTIPDFNAILELVGGTGLAATSYIFPGPLYLMLRTKVRENCKKNDLKMAASSKSTNEKIIRQDIDILQRTRNLSPNKLSCISHHTNSSEIPLWQYIVNGAIVFCGIIGAFLCVYNVFSAGANLETPCYLSGMRLRVSQVRLNRTDCFALSSKMLTNAAGSNSSFLT